MSIHKNRKTCTLLRRIKAGVLSVIVLSSLMANCAEFMGNTAISAVGEENTASSERSGAVEIPEGLKYEIELNSNAQWKVTFSGSAVIPANIFDADEFSAYKNNIDEISIGKDITGIADQAFEGLEGLHSVEFDENSNVTSIGKAAFKDCEYLETVNLEKCTKLTAISDGAFQNTKLTEVAFPSTLKEVGEKAFYECKDLTSIDFAAENSNAITFGAEAFANCTALKDIDLQNCTGSITFKNNDEWTTVFHGCTALEEVTVPSSAKGNLIRLFNGATSLKTITFETNDKIEEVTHIVSGSPVEVLDLTPLTGLDTFNAWCFSGDSSITKIIIPSNISSFGQQAMAEMSSLGTVEFKTNSNIKYLGNQLFRNDTSLNSVNLEALSNLLSISESAFDGCTALASITIPNSVTTIQDNAFRHCVGLVDLKYNAANLTTVGNGIFDGAGIFNLTIGENVNSIPANFLSQAQGHISGLKFEGTPTFTVGKSGEDTGLDGPFETGGKYTVDKSGNLYKIADGEAILVYANKTEEKITVPGTVNGYTVTGIAKNAFKNANVTDLTIEKPENIKTIEDYAFANATRLESINDKTKVEDAKDLFKGVDIKDISFFNTKIGTGIKDETKEEVFPPEDVTGAENAQTQPHDTPIDFYRDSTKTLNYTVSNAGKEIADGTERSGKFWTGEVAEVSFGYKDEHPVRIYIKADKDAVIKLNSNGIEPIPTGVDGIYYYDIVHKDAQTGTDQLNLSYENFSPPGSKMQVWAVEFDDVTAYNEFKDKKEVIYPASGDKDGTYKVNEKYFEIEWTTKPNDFVLKKEWAGNENVNFIKSSDGKTTVSNLKWNITFKKEDATSKEENLGSDIIRYIDYTDTLTLPEGLSWRKEIGENLANTHFIKKGSSSTLYISINGKEYELFTLSNFENLVSMSIDKGSDGNYQLHWRLINPKTDAEIDPVNGSITFGPEVIVAADGIKAGEDLKDLNNTVSADEYFTFSEMKKNSSSSPVADFKAPEVKLNFKKEVLNDVSRMGEDVQYRITVENPTVFDYTGMNKITDDLNTDERTIHYIKPENMQALFDDKDNGDKLTITISNAVLAKKLDPKETEADAINNKEKAAVSEQNTAADERVYNGLATEDNSVAHRNVTITLKKEGGNIKLTCTGGDPSVTYEAITIGTGGRSSIAEALSEIGYIVTGSDSYKLEWDYPTDFVFKGGQTMVFDINASIKDSLMYLPEKDHNYFYAHPDGINIDTYNSAEMENDDDTTLTADTYEDGQWVKQDLEIRKGAYVDGKELDKDYQPKDNDVIDYFVKAIHYGSGSYEVLPVVDHMTGKQAVIVEAELNEKADWASKAEKITIDKTDYYVLNKEGTYNGVYTGKFYADSITVKEIPDGLDTLIKYYIKNTPERDFELDITYQAITSQEYAGNESTNVKYNISNAAWLNDRPGHRIYDTIVLNGSAVSFDKKILIGGMKADPEEEELVKELPIKENENKVTYRLMLHSTTSIQKDESGKITDIGPVLELTGNDIFDMLPLTGTAFDWSKENISNITYRTGEAGYEKVEEEFKKTAYGKFTYTDTSDKTFTLDGASDGSEWIITDKCPSKVIEPSTDTTGDQQYIQWDENFKVTLPPQATMYMYVTLTFPGLDKDSQWSEFLNEKNDDTLYNTFYVHDIPASVTHTLADPPLAFLQKGVYETGSYITENDARWLTEQYFSGPDRYHYSNTYNRSRLKNTVTYYVVLRNSGKTNLYLAPIYDILPPGFTYMGLRTLDGSGSQWYDVGNKDTKQGDVTWNSYYKAPTSYGDKTKILAKPGDDDFSDSDTHFVQTRVKYSYANDSEMHTTKNDCQILKFEFFNEEGDNKLNEDKNGRSYLAPGQYLQFGYTVYTGNNEDITEAVNTVAMQYYDPLNTGVTPELDDKTPVIVKDIHKTSPNNDGERYLWENEYAEKFGFDETIGDNKEPKWFASDVKLTRSKISPGIKKTVDNPMISTEKDAAWTVTSFNNSPSELSGYTITDTVDLPLQFKGEFKYCLYGPNGEWYAIAGGAPENSDSYLFSITRDGDNITVTPNGGTAKTTTIDGEKVELEAKTVCNKTPTEDVKAKFTVQISRDEDHEVLTIGFTDGRCSIIPNGYSELKFSTPSEKGKEKTDPGIYTNTARFSPNDTDYDDRITQGALVEDDAGNNLGVEHSAVVSIYTGSPSGSVKMIEEKDDISNFTTSEREDNYIRLLDKKNVFTYTLEVRNVSDTAEMKDLVLIDNLPEIGDTTTLRQQSKRESEFKVDLAEEPNVEVRLFNDYKVLEGEDKNTVSPAKKYDKDTDYTVLTQGTDYTVEYSDINGNGEAENNSFIEADWEGENSDSRWYDEPKGTTRSIRIHFKNKVIAENQAVQIRFDAQIHNDENAVPGKIAWNTFGYSYKVNSVTAKASPNKVGICIPGRPTLSKKVVDPEGNPSPVSKDTTFKFIIYKSDDIVELKDNTPETVADTLTEQGIDFMYAELEVDFGETTSKKLPLENFVKYDYYGDKGFKKFEGEFKDGFWDTDKTYYIVELDTGEDFSYISTNSAEENNYSFKIDPIRNTELSFVNENENSTPVVLPSAGGKGRKLFIFGGLTMIFPGIFVLVKNRRKRIPS